LKKLAGHESLETTMKYIHLNELDYSKPETTSLRSAKRFRVGILLGTPENSTKAMD
jgi:hypothetical protein